MAYARLQRKCELADFGVGRQPIVAVSKLLTVYITKCNGQGNRLYIREGILCSVGGNLCRR
jgi:hypothetical protein